MGKITPQGKDACKSPKHNDAIWANSRDTYAIANKVLFHRTSLNSGLLSAPVLLTMWISMKCSSITFNRHIPLFIHF